MKTQIMKTQKTLIGGLALVCSMTFISCEKETSIDQIVASESSQQISAKAKKDCDVTFMRSSGIEAVFINTKGQKKSIKIPKSEIQLGIVNGTGTGKEGVFLRSLKKTTFNTSFFKAGITRFGFVTKKALSKSITLQAPLFRNLKNEFSTASGQINKKKTTKTIIVPKTKTFNKGSRINFMIDLTKSETKEGFTGFIGQGVSPSKGCPRFS